MPQPTSEVETIYLVGVAGNPNLGDELIVLAWLEHLAEHFPGADVWLDTPFPGPAATLLAGKHPRLHVTDTLFRLRDRAVEDGADETDTEAIGAFMTRALADPGHAPWWTSGIDLVRSADVIHLVGGGYANELWPHNLALFDALAWLAQHTAGRVGVTGVGLLPLGSDAAARVARAGQHLDLFDVRDVGTAHALLEAGAPSLPLRVTGDDILLRPPHLDPVTAARFEVGIVVQDDLRSMDWQGLVDFVRRQLAHWGTGPDRVAVVECMPRVDALIFESLARELPGITFISFHEAWRDGFPAAGHQRWISTRYHPHLLAAMAGARGVAVSVRGDYYGTKHELVQRAGSGWPLVTDLDDDVPASAAVELPSRLPELSRKKLESARMLYGTGGSGQGARLRGALGGVLGRLTRTR